MDSEDGELDQVCLMFDELMDRVEELSESYPNLAESIRLNLPTFF
jgi:uncharacterized protein YdhG (YjbR/CyaY superfamily)